MRILGLDIGGTKVQAVIWDGRRVLSSVRKDTPRTGKGMARLLADIAGKTRPDAVGVGVAGVVSGTRVLRSTNIPYLKNFDFRTVFGIRVPLRIDNDARCFARAEYFGVKRQGSGVRGSMMALTLGTGVGRAFENNGTVRRIRRFEDAEPWEEEYRRVRDWGDDELLAGFLSGRLAGLIRSYRPETVVIGGGVAGREKALRLFRAYFLREKLAHRVERSRLGENAAALGAAMLFRNQQTPSTE